MRSGHAGPRCPSLTEDPEIVPWWKGATRSWGRLVGFSPVLVSATVLVVLLALIRVWARLGAVGSAPARHRLG